MKCKSRFFNFSPQKKMKFLFSGELPENKNGSRRAFADSMTREVPVYQRIALSV